MDRVSLELVRLYGNPDVDWLNYKITRDNPISFHHIQKDCDGGKRVISNGGLLTNYSHRYLHIIETREYKLYLVLNNILKLINMRGYNPTNEERKIINEIFLEFEYYHKNDLNNKGKTLIRKEYLTRYS